MTAERTMLKEEVDYRVAAWTMPHNQIYRVIH